MGRISRSEREMAKRRRIQKALPGRERIPEQPAGGIRSLLAAIAVLEKLEADESSAKLVEGDTGLVLLLKLHRADLIEPYVLFSLGDAGIARDYTPWRVLHRGRLDDYLDRFVVPPLHCL